MVPHQSQWTFFEKCVWVVAQILKHFLTTTLTGPLFVFHISIFCNSNPYANFKSPYTVLFYCYFTIYFQIIFSNIWRETRCPAWILTRTMAAHLAALEIAPTGSQTTPNCANMDVTWIWVELTMTWLWAEPEGGAHKGFAAMWHWEMLMETVIHPKDSQRIQA